MQSLVVNLDMADLLSNAGSLKLACTKAMRCMGLAAWQEEGQPHKHPSPATLSRSIFRVDVMLTSWRQTFWEELFDKSDGDSDPWIVLCSDGSSIGGRDWFITEEDTLLPSDAHLLFETRTTPASCNAISRNCLTPVCVGSGMADLPHKLAALVHQVRLDLGPTHRMQRYFRRVISYVSDMGTEHLLSGVPDVDLQKCTSELVNASGGLLQADSHDMQLPAIVRDHGIDLQPQASNGLRSALAAASFIARSIVQPRMDRHLLHAWFYQP
jgi:hypothetical protein